MAKNLCKIYRQLKDNKFDAMIVTSPANLRYVTGFTGRDSWAVITSRQIYLITDSRYIQQANQDCPNCKIISRQNSIAEEAVNIINKKAKITAVAAEDSLDIKTYQYLSRKLTAKIKPTNAIIERCREIKTADEIKHIIQAGKIAIKALKETLPEIKRGITEVHLAAILEYNIKKNNSTPSFETIVAFGANASRPHHCPGAKKLKKNDTILIDFGAVCNGYASDITRCFTTGKASKDYLNAYKAVFQAQKAAIRAVKAGVKIAHIAETARKELSKANLPQYGHGTGHGLGLEVHELPVVSSKQKKAIAVPGQIITIEPGVYIPDSYGIRIEDDVLVTEDGGQILTSKIFANSDLPTSIS